ncbi:MAG: ATP-binding cassette domain-containing protein [Bacteroidales bacterium]|nr:ATP-binding cassette domain-containing protein [Bacteroidales bacterium]
MEDNVVIRFSDVSVYQKETDVLAHVSFDIRKGEFVYLIGVTGSGKSSILRTIYADIPLRKGSANVAGYDLGEIRHSEVPFLRRKLGIIFQDFQLLSDRNVRENLIFVMRATGWKDKKTMETRIGEVLSRVGLESKIHQMPHQLSGGEQQRVAIARALINNPQIVLADEPTGNLDPETSRGIVRLLLEISRSGRAVLMATHNYSLFKEFPARTLKCDNHQLIPVENQPA